MGDKCATQMGDQNEVNLVVLRAVVRTRCLNVPRGTRGAVGAAQNLDLQQKEGRRLLGRGDLWYLVVINKNKRRGKNDQERRREERRETGSKTVGG